MTRLVIKLSGGLIKDQRQASYVLSFVAVVLLGISVYLFYGSGPKYKKTLNPVEPVNIYNLKH